MSLLKPEKQNDAITLSDRYLRDIRQQMLTLFETDKTVIDFGCGGGEFLKLLEPHVRYAIGIDRSFPKNSYAYDKDLRCGKNITFIKKVITRDISIDFNFEIATSTLFLHTVPRPTTLQLMALMREKARKAILCELTHPANLYSNMLLSIDQFFTGHKANFEEFKAKGCMEGLLYECGIKEYRIIPTKDKSLNFYCIDFEY